MKASPLTHSRYLFVFAHPDDEIYTGVIISELIKTGKTVNAIYITSGDYHGPEMVAVRESEVSDSMKHIGLSMKNVTFLHIPERELMDRAREAYDKTLDISKRLNPDCIVGHDFEGGHNAHDLVSFYASRAAQESWSVDLYVFPAYHGWPENRVFNQFAPPQADWRNIDPTTNYELIFTNEQRHLKNEIVLSHKSQEKFIDSILLGNSSDRFTTREVLRHVPAPIDYLKPPADPVGYEYPGSKITFEGFKKVLEQQLLFQNLLR